MDPLHPTDPSHIGRYPLTGRLGTGGMGQVYLARTPSRRQIVIKVIRSELAQDQEFRTRFAREAEAARRVGGFRIACPLDADSMTTRDAVFGILPYMSPEQTNGSRVGPTSDVFSLGTVLAFAATNPFTGAIMADTVRRLISPPPDPDPSIRVLITECWNHDPAQRLTPGRSSTGSKHTTSTTPGHHPTPARPDQPPPCHPRHRSRPHRRAPLRPPGDPSPRPTRSAPPQRTKVQTQPPVLKPAVPPQTRPCEGRF